MLVTLGKLQEKVSAIKMGLSSPEYFEKEITDGTIEELKSFLLAVSASNEDIKVMDNISEEQKNDILSKYGESGRVTVIETDEEGNTVGRTEAGENKEVAT